MTISLPWWRAARDAATPASAGLSLHAAAPAPITAPPSVEIQGLSLGYRGKRVLQDLDWRLQPGQVVGLLGRNGAGKTTLLETLLGLRDAEAGMLRLFGEAPGQLSDANRARIGYVPQQSDLFEGLSADELLAYFRSFYPRWNQAKVEQLLTRWTVPRDVAIGRLSGGEQQRLSIIRALAHEPELLVLDEPVASLDPLARRDFLRELVGQVLDRGCTVVFSTHILSDLERVAFQVAFLQQGRIRLQQPLDELLDEVQLLQGDEEQLARLSSLHGVECLARLPGRWLMRGLPDTLPAGLLAQRATLEDLFEALT